jgi:hypothetical protein
MPLDKSARFRGMDSWLYNNLPPPVNMRVGGLSIEDFTNRLMVWTIYIPQGIMAIKYKQHPFETWGRNIIIWLGMLGVNIVGKHPKYGFNAGFNALMTPKEKLAPLPQSITERAGFFFKNPRQILNHLANPFRIDRNYLEIAREAGVNLKKVGVKGNLAEAVKGAVWSKFDVNEHEKILGFADILLERAEKAGGSRLKARLTEQAQLVKKVAFRISAMKYLSVAAAAILMSVFVGVFLQKLVFMFIAPLDKKLVPTTKLKTGSEEGANPMKSGVRTRGYDMPQAAGYSPASSGRFSS